MKYFSTRFVGASVVHQESHCDMALRMMHKARTTSVNASAGDILSTGHAFGPKIGQMCYGTVGLRAAWTRSEVGLAES